MSGSIRLPDILLFLRTTVRHFKNWPITSYLFFNVWGRYLGSKISRPITLLESLIVWGTLLWRDVYWSGRIDVSHLVTCNLKIVQAMKYVLICYHQYVSCLISKQNGQKQKQFEKTLIFNQITFYLCVDVDKPSYMTKFINLSKFGHVCWCGLDHGMAINT